MKKIVKKLGIKEIIIILAVLPPVNVSALFGLWYAVHGVDCMLSNYDGFDGFILGGGFWFVVIYPCKLGLLAAAGIVYGFVKLYKLLVNAVENAVAEITNR